MPTTIVKVSKDRDLYVGWSSVVEAPVWYSTRAGALDCEDVTEERLARADEAGTSALWGQPGSQPYGWEHAEGFIYMQMGRLRRDRLGDLIAALDAGGDDQGPAVRALLDPFEDDA